jgi:two-component system, NtrC family, response regulator GlrR
MSKTALSGEEPARSQAWIESLSTSEATQPQVSDAGEIRRDITLKTCLSDLVGTSPTFTHVLDEIRILAGSDASVLISGETGTGKDMCARAIHCVGSRADRPFIPINCGSIPEDLWENEFFGHERGAYTDARERSGGLLKEADGGTLFLDDIETLTIKNQVKLLRFLQTGSYIPLGSAREVRANVRLIAATNEDLLCRMRDQTFRGDFYFRLAVLTLHLSPLRERVEDIPLLAVLFLKRYAAQYNKNVDRISKPAMASLCRHSWPGNVRELENIIHRAVIHCTGSELKTFELTLEEEERAGIQCAPSDRATFKEVKRDLIACFEKDYVLNQLRTSGGNISEAARRSGKNRRAFWELIRKYHIMSESVVEER